MNARTRLSNDEVRRAAHEWRDRNARNALSPSDAETFAAWLAADVRHEQAYDRAITVWNAVSHLRADDLDADLLRPSALEANNTLSTRLRGWLTTNRGKLATATLAILVAAPLVLWSMSDEPAGRPEPIAQAQTYTTATGQIRAITLPDGSKATLGASTAMSYQSTTSSRELVLERGEVFLEVSPDATRPFHASADALESTVVGTAFEIRYNGGISRVAVQEGEVLVTYPLLVAGRATGQRQRVNLTAGAQTTAEQGVGLSQATPIAIAKIGAWREQRLIYDGATLLELLTDIQRYADLDIDIDPALDLSEFGKISASFNSRDIETMAETLPDLFPVTIDQSQSGRLVVAPARP